MKQYKILMTGNPNVGKSSIFNILTGENQHTGNWIGKTVESALGQYIYDNKNISVYDLPGMYSLNSKSKEEELARDYILNEQYDLIVVVVDACALERNLNLLLQILEVKENIVLCVNLIDEAEKKGIYIDEKEIEKILNIPVIKTSARKNIGIETLKEVINKKLEQKNNVVFQIEHPIIKQELDLLLPLLEKYGIKSKWIATKLILNEIKINQIENDYEIKKNLILINNYINKEEIKLANAEDYNRVIKNIIEKSVKKENDKKRKYGIDTLLTSKFVGISMMLILLMLIFYITIVLANYPSDLLFNMFNILGNKITLILSAFKIPEFIILPLMNGIYKTLVWVVSVMLPPMAIFFPMFSLLEDIGYLPRLAFNIDGIFQKCNSCGKQALTMMMGFGCNAVGVTGTRIIDSKRERLIAILTNVFVPCNGRFPMIISIITMFLVINNSNIIKTIILLLFILLGCIITFFISKLLSKTLLKGESSSIILELPPFRRPNYIKTIVRSFKDKTLKVLKRAIVVSIPTGLLIWIFANIKIGDLSILQYINNFLEPLGNIMGLDGVILTAFLLAFPANEIVIPIIIMTYLSTGEMLEYESLNELKELLVNNGWTIKTAICTIIFSIFHFPCSTTVLTIKKETGNIKWTLLSILIPTIIGIILCILINIIFVIV